MHFWMYLSKKFQEKNIRNSMSTHEYINFQKKQKKTHISRLSADVEPAVNRQPGYRRGAVEQSMADTSTATFQEN